MNKSRSLCNFLLISTFVLLLVGCISSSSNNSIDDSVRFVPEAIAAQDGTVIRVQPLVQHLNIADTAIVEIYIDNVTNLFAAEIELQFDPNILQARDADPSKEGIQIQPGSFLAPDFVISDEIDNETGIARYALAQLAPKTPVSGSGVLASITFQAVGEGSSQLTFTLTQLATGEGQEIAVTAQSGQIIVGQAVASPTPPTTTVTPTTESDQATATPLSSTPIPEPTFTPLPTTSTPTVSPTVTQPLSPSDTPTPPTANIPPNATIGFCYRVQEGDTIYKLGQEFGINPYHINVVNDLYPPGQIFFYQALFLPEQYGYGPNKYIVKPGDTLSNIAEHCGIPVSFLASVNNLNENAVLQNGQILTIPIPPFPPPARFSYPLPQLQPMPVPLGHCDYIVQPGDTLYSIGQRYGISPDALARANNLNNPHHIYVGQCLTLVVY